MKLLIVSPTLNFGGAERVAAIWANGFVNQGHQVFFVTNIEDSNVYQLSEQVHVLPLTRGQGVKFLKYIHSLSLLRSYYKDYRPDVIIGVMYACSLLAMIAALGLKIPVINTEHNSFERPRQYPMSFIDRVAKFYVNYFYDGITVLTRADLEVIRNRFKNVYVLPNPTFLTPLKNVPSKQNIVLAAGRLDAWRVKGFDVLIEAWGKLVDSLQFTVDSEGWKLQIAGTGSEKSLNYLKQLCKENGVESSVEFLGFRKDVEKLYQEASIFVLSSRYEGFGLVLIEAMSQGCACVACDYKGRQREIVEDDSIGLVCRPDDSDDLENKLRSVIENQDYRHLIQKKSLERARDYNLANIMKKWDEILANYN